MTDINQELLHFLSKSTTQFQAIDSISSLLDDSGFKKLKENSKWDIKAGKYYVIRNGSSIIAFDIPNKISDYHYQICSSHSDSPTFKIKSISEIEGPASYLRLNVQMYGGSILYTWLDKPLSIAGRVLVKENNKAVSKKLYIDKDLFIIPSLPIHFNRDVNKGYEFNVQVDMCPLFSNGQLHKGDFVSMIAKQLKIKKENILSYDLFLVNRQEPKIVGYKNEFICAPKLDNLQSAFTSLKAFIDCKNSKHINVYTCFDNEEVGSLTKQGASSTFLYDVLFRINSSLKKSNDDFISAISTSFNVSFDSAHAVHPNHQEKYDNENRCFMNKGITIKENASQSYTTDAFSRAIFTEICEKANVPYQTFSNRSDIRSGSTLGNLSNNQVSLNSIDIGLPILAMHSSYETAGSKDNEYAYETLKKYYSSNIIIDGTESFEIH